MEQYKHCDKCKNAIISSNYDLHILRCPGLSMDY